MKKLAWILPAFMIALMLSLSSCNEHVHDFGEWTTVTPATCTEQGEEARTCSCGETQTQIINGGHKMEISPEIAATCTQSGTTEGKHCSVCGHVFVPTQEIEAKGHEKKITTKQILPTCDESGVSEGAYCSRCQEVLSVSTELPARGYDYMLEDGEFKILLIGNSFTRDASNYSPGISSQLHTILQAMLGDNVKVTVGILVKSDRGLNWHATQASYGEASADFHLYSTDNPTWTSKGLRTHADALQWTNWDIVSLQPYGLNSKGTEANNFPAEVHYNFLNIADSTAYLLDLVANNAPQAEVYCYMHWAFSTMTGLNANSVKYNEMAEFFPSVLEYQGTETGKRFTSLIPVGLSVQNARTTYLQLLSYNPTAYLEKPLNYQIDPQIGLQRDQGHLSYNIGRYIAALTFAEMLVPESLRAANYTLPYIRKTESIGVLPRQYSIIAQEAVFSAVESWRQGRLFAVTDLSAYAKDPTTLFAESFAAGLTLKSSDSVDTIKRTVTETISTPKIQDLVVESIEFPTVTPGKDFAVSVTVRFGYTTLTFTVNCKF